MGKIFGSSKYAINKAIAELVDSAPENLNTLGKLASAVLSDGDGKITTTTVDAVVQLANDSSQYQNLTNSTLTEIEILLPPAPRLHKKFSFIVSNNSSAGFLVLDDSLLPGDRYEIVWSENGQTWLTL